MIAIKSQAHSRRGLTLVEMLVVVALTVLMMTIIAQIFQATTGAIQIARAYQEIEQDLRGVEGTIKRDLAGITAKMTPPLNPKDNLGYFEYGENEFADAQGEDSDDYLAFTTTYTDGNLFFGRYLPGPTGLPTMNGPDTRGSQATVAPKVITSDTAEVIYFLRNGNLYRRTFLVQPGLRLHHEYAFTQAGVYQGVSAANMPGISGLGRVGWQALNDISMRPAENVDLAYGPARQQLGLPAPGQLVFDTYLPDAVNTSVIRKYESEVRPIANSLGDLTNRQNRAFKPRFTNDYYTPIYGNDPMTGALVLMQIYPFPDGLADDFVGAALPNSNNNFDNQIDDFTPATYPYLIAKRTFTPYGVALNEGTTFPSVPGANSSYFPLGSVTQGYDTLGFPFVYPNAYSRTAQGSVATVTNIPSWGAIHGIALEYPSRKYDTATGAPAMYYLPYWNHNPLPAEDNLPTPGINPVTNKAYDQFGNSMYQSWWGFPTWREQLSPLWVDPLKRLNAPLQVTMPGSAGVPYQLRTGNQPFGLSWNFDSQPLNWLPEMMSPLRIQDQPFSEPSANAQSGANSYFYNNMSNIWTTTWEDDLIATNVRSFDVKVFEPSPEIQSYVDLGYLATPTGGTSIAPSGSAPFAPGQTTTMGNWLLGFGHEGRMPPLTSDYRLDSQYPFIPGVGPRYLGDDDSGVVRLRRVWDSWSTDYSAVDAKTLDPLTAPPFQPAPRPSYPPPYPVALRGIQIQIRMTDPRQERVRTITIHQDFTSKL